MFPYDKKLFEHNCKLVNEQNHLADIVLSIGPKVFDYFTYRHDDPSSIKHLQLIPLPDNVYFDLPTPSKLPDSRNFQILTPFEHCAIPELNKSGVVPKAMNLVASTFEKLQEPPKWEILCTQKSDDKDVMKHLDLHSKLRLFIKGFVKDAFFEELSYSHLVMFPPSSVNSLFVTITTIASGRPIIVPTMSEGDIFIEKYFPDYRDDVVVEMRSGPDALKDQIVKVVQRYPVYLERAKEMKKMLKTTVMKELIKVNSEFVEEIERRTRRSRSQQEILRDQLTANESAKSHSTGLPPPTSQGRVSTSQPTSEQQRAFGTVSMQVAASYGNATNASSMDKVEAGLYEHEGKRPTTEGTGGVLNGLHKNLEVEKIGKGCLRYVMRCGSLEALEALWSEYISGRLDKTIHSSIITPTLLSKIQAHYLTLDIYISVQEYLLCKREIPLLTGSAPALSRRCSVAAITELKAAPHEDITRHHTVDGLNLLLSQMQIRDNQTISDLLSRDDFSVEELQGHRSTFVTKQRKVTADVKVNGAKFRQFEITRDELKMTLNDEISSFCGVDDDKVTEFVQLKIHASKHSAHSKAVLHEAGQKLKMQREDITNQATPLREKSEAGKTLINELQSDIKRATQGFPVKGSVLEVFGEGSDQFTWPYGIYIKKNGQWVICDRGNHRVQVIDPIKLCCDLILQFHAFPNPFFPVNVTVDEDNDKYFMSDLGNGQVVVSSGQSQILNCFGRKQGIAPTDICLSPDGFIFISDLNGYVRKYRQSGKHIARTAEGQVKRPDGLVVNKKCVFVSDLGRRCIHVLNHEMQSIREIGKGLLEGPEGLCFDHQQDGMYVCDHWGNRVVHFKCDGEFLGYIGQGQLEEPCYIAMCKDKPYRLVVTQEYCIKLLYI
ncbi:uncharacterized protein [Ptychodera flava]|uniref:uncharacterized protein n=1 Tax=Ptychodera flava TaxID=63121 RepID=UPI00396A97EE